ncbi:MAG: nickel-dependent hydrogenase large subunit [Anaerolineae bacterium]|nr:nickel-dependent hydrogenase large subunit [Anaerolineae bacterium]
MSRLVIPIGPQHPILKEPISLKVEVEGENITHVDLQIGFVHRGIEKLVESLNWVQAVPLIERICGICSHVHTTTYCQGVEQLAGIEVPKRALYLRTLMCELERIHSHLLWLGIVGRNIGQEAMFMYAWRDRELVMDVMEAFSGGRVSHQANTIGGVRFDPSPAETAAAQKLLAELESKVVALRNIVEHSESFISRTAGMGVMNRDDIRRYGLLGPVARASGVDFDLRRDRPYSVYPELDFKVIVRREGDVWARAMVRVEETMQSIAICHHIINKLPGGAVSVKAPRRVPVGEVISRTEAPRGEVVYYIRSEGGEHPARVKVRTPTLPTLASFPELLQGVSIADMTVIISGADLCIACADR